MDQWRVEKMHHPSSSLVHFTLYFTFFAAKRSKAGKEVVSAIDDHHQRTLNVELQGATHLHFAVEFCQYIY